jgi:UDP-2,4-diacetamido-2,4,6-trideoxy-beta-L-altropyranose hydrolase
MKKTFQHKQWFVIRADGDLEIGIGHLMRCLTIVEWLDAKNITPVLVYKTLPSFVRNLFSDYSCVFMRIKAHSEVLNLVCTHSNWLRGSEEEDAENTLNIISCLARRYNSKPIFILVDHYGITKIWEKIVSSIAPILVIDDLNDREHHCRWLVDQTYGKSTDEYADLVPNNCDLLVGSKYALLRREFDLESKNIKRDFSSNSLKLLITFGGVDKDDLTSKILIWLSKHVLIKQFQITVVCSTSNPNLEKVNQLSQCLSCSFKLLINATNMARIMSDQHLCIGAAGSTSWERCAVGLPTLSIVTADNQSKISSNLEKANAVLDLGSAELLKEEDFKICFEKLIDDRGLLENMSKNCHALCDGLGGRRVTERILQKIK